MRTFFHSIFVPLHGEEDDTAYKNMTDVGKELLPKSLGSISRSKKFYKRFLFKSFNSGSTEIGGKIPKEQYFPFPNTFAIFKEQSRAHSIWLKHASLRAWQGRR